VVDELYGFGTEPGDSIFSHVSAPSEWKSVVNGSTPDFTSSPTANDKIKGLRFEKKSIIKTKYT
jgi:hypothetical protein